MSNDSSTPTGSPITYSTLFNQDYGDFAMQSSDGVVFHFPKMLLEYISPFFKSMFSLSGHAKDSSALDNTKPLAMEEDSATLDNLFQWIDPAQLTPRIDPATIAGLLRAAHKYEIEKIIEWFAREVTAGQDVACLVESHRSLLTTNPMVVLSLAEQYNLPDIARLALRQLIVEPVKALLVENATMSARLLLHLHRLRKARTDWFLAQIERVSHGPYEHHICPQRYSCLLAWTRQVHDAPCWRSIEKDLPPFNQGCAECGPFPIELKPRKNVKSHSSVVPARAIDLETWEKEAKDLEKKTRIYLKASLEVNNLEDVAKTCTWTPRLINGLQG